MLRAAMPVRTLIADDQPLTRYGLQTLLRELPGLTLVGEARDGAEAVRLARERRAELAVVDLQLPGLSGLDVTRELAGLVPAPRVLVLSDLDADLPASDALRAGATGFALKTTPLRQLAEALEAVGAGRPWLAPELAGRLARAREGPASVSELSRREREVLAHVAEGLSSREIGDRLQLSPRTVDAHRVRLMKKLDIHKSPALVRFAIRAGLVAP